MTMNSTDRPFDLVILDLDGTILDLYRHTPISPAVLDAIAAVQAAGVPVTIATGRTLDYVRAHIAPLGVTTPVVTTQGAVIGDPLTGHIMAETTIPLELARRAAAWVDSRPFITAFYFHDDDGHIHIVQNRSGPDPDFYDHVFGHPRVLRENFVALLSGDSAHAPLKFIVIDDPSVPAYVDVNSELTALFSPALSISRTHPRLVEGTARGIDKGQGVLRLCHMLGIDPARVLAIGDSDNDIPMLAAVGCGVAMGNASPGVLAVANWVAPPIEEDGAAIALRRFVLPRTH
jgi:Cof subfamily protein (haloacid dehalogenase superfamily)